MKACFQFIFIVVIHFTAIAQDASLVDEFLKDFESAQNDATRCEALWQAAFNSAHSDARSGLNYGEQALQFAVKLNDAKLKGDAENSIAFCFDSLGELDSAQVHYSKSIQYLESGGYHCEVASVYGNLGSLFKKKHEFATALNWFMYAENLQKQCENIGYHATTLYSIGTCYNSLHDYKRALDYFDRSLKMEVAENNISKQGNVHNGMANAFLGSGDLESAKREYLETIRCFNASDNVYSMAYAYEGLAQLFRKKELPDSAIFYCTKALDIFKQLNIKFDVVFESIMLANYFEDDGRPDEAKKILLSILPLTFSENLPYDRQEALALLAVISEKQKRWNEAYVYLNQSMKLRDSLKIEEQNTELAELAGKYETEKRDRQIELEQAENLKQKIENENQKQLKYFFMAGSGMLLILALVLLGRYRQKRRSSKLLTEKNELIEKEKLRAEKSEKVKQQFLANMSHEIRTPMNAITGLSRLLMDRKHDTTTTEYLRAIHHSGENLNVILNDILDLSKMEAGKLSIHKRPFHLRMEVNNVVQIFKQKAEEKGIQLHVLMSEKLPEYVLGDSARIFQVLINLISNAIKFTIKGSVSLEIQCDVEENQIFFKVKDTGIGIPPEKANQVFESFMQTNEVDSRIYGGTGLGLTIARDLISLMGGQLKMKSVVNEGSEFYFSLVLPATSDSQVSHAEPALRKFQHSLQILVAEDNDYNFIVTRDTLKKYFPNAECFRASNGKQAIEFSTEDEFDLILMDIQMPLIDGYQATAKIRLSDPDIAIIGLTASVIKSDLDKCIVAGMNGYILKPFSEIAFVEEINRVLKLDEASSVFVATSLYTEDELHEMYIQYIPEKLSMLRRAFASRNLAEVKSVCHAMRPQLMRSEMTDAILQMEVLEMAAGWNNDMNTLVADLIFALEKRMNVILARK